MNKILYMTLKKYLLIFFIAQVNPCMPRTFGDGIIHKSHFDYAVEVNTPIVIHDSKPLSDIEKSIGKHIAENLVDDGATLQMGSYYCFLKLCQFIL